MTPLFTAFLAMLLAIALPPGNASADHVTITIDHDPFPAAVVGDPWSVIFTASSADATPPYHFSMSPGNLDGLTMADNGTLSGTPAQTGHFTATITATDSSPDSDPGSLDISIDVTANVSIAFGALTGDGPAGHSLMVGFPIWAPISVDGPVGDSHTPSGAVTLTGQDGTSCTLTLNAGQGSCALFFTASGVKAITATYSGDTYFNASAGTASPTIEALDLGSKALATGRNHTCLLEEDGAWSCWGLNYGYPAVPPATPPTTLLAAGEDLTCARKADGSLQCWGEDSSIKNGVPAGKAFVAVSIGRDAVCAIDANRELTCWGDGEYPGGANPIKTSPVGTYQAVTVGATHACAIRTNGAVVCWGALDPDGPNRLNPGGLTAQAIAAGDYHTCAIKPDHSLACWGDLSGDYPVPLGNSYTSISSGADYSCAQKTGGQLACWGGEDIGVDTTTGYLNLGSGAYHTCAILDDPDQGDSLACWRLPGDTLPDKAPSLSLHPAAEQAIYVPNGRTWSQAFTPGGSGGAYTLAISSGSLPGGLSLSGQSISGTTNATVGQDYGFTLRLTESWPNAAGLPLPLAPALRSYTYHVQSPATTTGLAVVTAPNPDGAYDAGAPVTIRATVTKNGALDLTGDVTMTSDGETCSSSVSAAGTADCTLFYGSGGVKEIQATYAGDTFYLPSTASPASLTVNPPTFRPMIAAGNEYTCSINSGGQPTCWGKDDSGQATPPLNRLFSNLSAGGATSCAVGADTRLSCWGWDSYGLVSLYRPPWAGYTSVSVGAEFACAQDYWGYVTCWGNLPSGLGVYPGLLAAKSISAGQDHFCGLNIGGMPLCWGDDTYGQRTVPPGTPALSAISAGGQVTCGIRSDTQAVVCWGSALSRANLPGASEAFEAVSAGDTHACGILHSADAAVDGTLRCWGDITGGKTAYPAGHFTTIDAGYDHTCALRTDGFLQCWGNNASGQAPVIGLAPASLPAVDVGVSWTQELDLTGGRVAAADGQAEGYAFSVISGTLPPGVALSYHAATRHEELKGPATAAGDYDFTLRITETGFSPALAADKAYHLHVRSAVTVMTSISPASPRMGEPVTVTVSVVETPGGAFTGRDPSGLVTVTALNPTTGNSRLCTVDLDAGEDHCIIYLIEPGEVEFSAAYPGDADFTPGDSLGDPARVSVPSFEHPSTLAAGPGRTFIFLGDGRLYCIGSGCDPNTFTGEYAAFSVGAWQACARTMDGSLVCELPGHPTGQWTEVAVGARHACALSPAGAPTCWGAGYGTPPGALADRMNQISAGTDYTCGIRKSDGSLACWGDGALGPGVPPAGDFTALAAGPQHACALRTDGSLACWGANTHGESTPPAGNTFTRVSAGDGFSCALDGQGHISCWGDNELGQTDEPLGVMTELASYGGHSAVLRDGLKLTFWGDNPATGEAPLVYHNTFSPVSIPALSRWDFFFDMAGDDDAPYGNRTPYAASIVSGTLPASLAGEEDPFALSPAGDHLAGVPGVPGVYDFTIRWEDNSPFPLVDVHTYQVTVTGGDLSVAIAPIYPGPALVANEFGFEYTVHNATLLPVPNVRLRVDLPPALEGLIVDGLAGCTPVGVTLDCLVGTLDPGASLAVRVTGRLTRNPGPILVTRAQVGSTEAAWPEIAEADNSASLSVPVEYQAEAYDETFDGAAPSANWSSGSVIVSPGGPRYLGDFDGSSPLGLSLSGLAPHKRLVVSFDLYIIGPWEGASATGLGEEALPTWQYGLPGEPPLFAGPFCSSGACDVALFPVSRNELGFPGDADARYHLTSTFWHSAGSLELAFSSSALPTGARWGIDNLVITLDSGETRIFLPVVKD